MYLEITDLTTSLRLDGSSGSNYFAVLSQRYAPKVSRINPNSLANNIFENVMESIPLFARSSTDIATVLENVETLNTLITQAERWFLGENVDPVFVRYSPVSDSTYLTSLIIGPPPGTQSAINLPSNFPDYLSQKRIRAITLSFVRIGQWFDEEDNATGSTVKQGVKGSVSFTEAPPTPSPVKVTATLGGVGPGDVWTGSPYFLFANHTNDIEVLDLSGTSETNALGGAYRSVSATTTEAYLGLIDAADTMPANRVAIYGTVDCQSPNVLVRISLYVGSVEKFTNWMQVDTTDKEGPQPFYFGTIAFPEGEIASAKFYYKTTTGTETVNVDYLVLFNVANRFNRAIRVFFDVTLQNDLTIDHKTLESPVGRITLGSTSPGYIGSTNIICEGQNLYYIQVGTGYDDEWRTPAYAGGIEDFDYEFDLLPGSLIPR